LHTAQSKTAQKDGGKPSHLNAIGTGDRYRAAFY